MDFALAQLIVDVLLSAGVPMSAPQITKTLGLKPAQKTQVNSTLYRMKSERTPIGEPAQFLTSEGATPPMWSLTSPNSNQTNELAKRRAAEERSVREELEPQGFYQFLTPNQPVESFHQDETRIRGEKIREILRLLPSLTDQQIEELHSIVINTVALNSSDQ